MQTYLIWLEATKSVGENGGCAEIVDTLQFDQQVGDELELQSWVQLNVVVHHYEHVGAGLALSVAILDTVQTRTFWQAMISAQYLS